MRIVVLGGYGNFGARICRALAASPGIEVIAAGRRPTSAPADFYKLGIRSIALDIAAADFQQALRAAVSGIVIHCVGPFQGQDYRVAEAVLANGAHYIDLADGRDFVAHFANGVSGAAGRAGRLAVSGASTLPALSSAVADALAPRFARIDSIHSIIAPAQRAPRGVATLAGVMSYAGKPFQTFVHGAWQTAYGWLDVQPVTVGTLGQRLSAVCDVPDLALFPARYPGLTTAWFRAALEIGVQHRGIALLAGLRRMGMAMPLERFAGLMEAAARVLDRFGSETGGMEVRVSGASTKGKSLTLIWRIIAPDNHGPEIPCMAAVLLARKLAAGDAAGLMAAQGAHPCMGFITLDEFAPEFAKWGMRTEVEELP